MHIYSKLYGVLLYAIYFSWNMYKYSPDQVNKSHKFIYIQLQDSDKKKQIDNTKTSKPHHLFIKWIKENNIYGYVVWWPEKASPL